MSGRQSFSQRVKEEAAGQLSARRHCNIAELAGMISLSNLKIYDKIIKIQVENVSTLKKCFTIIRKTFNIEAAFSVQSGGPLGSHRRYCLTIMGAENVKLLLDGIKMDKNTTEVSDVVFTNNCCKRAFIRGCFLAQGSVTDPEKSYHLEIVTPVKNKAEQLCRVINSFWSEPEEGETRYVTRKRSGGRECYVVYVKEGNQISDLLNICETYRCLMEMENIRVRKEIANSLNRVQNCEMANMVKTITAAQEKKGDIEYIDERIGLEALPIELKELAKLRVEYPDISLRELGEMLTPPVGKSGVNHRLRKIKKIADDLREGRR